MTLGRLEAYCMRITVGPGIMFSIGKTGVPDEKLHDLLTEFAK